MKPINPPIARLLLASLITISSTSIYTPGNALSSLRLRSEQPVAILFDLGGILFETDYSKALWFLGPKNLMGHATQHFLFSKSDSQSEISIRKKFYQVLNAINQTETNHYGVHDENGYPLPEIMCDWLSSRKPNKEILHHVFNEIEKHPEWFTSFVEQTLVKRMAIMIFDPITFIHTRKPIKDGITLLKECKDQGFEVYILSNWDQESFQLLRKEYTEIFDLCDGFFISGNLHLVKPSRDIFEYVKQQNPHIHWILIDDQKENTDAAKRANIDSIRCGQVRTFFKTRPDYKNVRKKLYEMLYIPQKKKRKKHHKQLSSATYA